VELNMSHFYGEIFGARGIGSRGGHKEGGIGGHIRGWNNGVSVSGSHNKTTGEDIFTISATRGSNGGGNIEIARIEGEKITLMNKYKFNWKR
jgi:hypothetical protein